MRRIDEFNKLYWKFKKNIRYIPFQYGLRSVFVIVALLTVKSILTSNNTEESAKEVHWWLLILIILAIIILIAVLVRVIMKISRIETPLKEKSREKSSKTYLKNPSWVSEMLTKTLRLIGGLVVLSMFAWFLFWITGHKNPVAYITGDQTQEVTAPAGNWTNWIEVEEHWRFKLFYDGKIALNVKLRNGKEFTVLSEQRDNNGIPLYITDAATGKLLPMVTSDKITDIRIKSVEATPITVKIEHWKEEYPRVQQ